MLTVGASPDFLDLGGMINLRFVGRRVRFLGRRGQREAAGRTMAEHRAALR